MITEYIGEEPEILMNPLPRLEWVHVKRRGPILVPAGGNAEGNASASASVKTYGLDLTAGCAHACAFCHFRATPLYVGEKRVLFDPEVADRLGALLDVMPVLPQQVVLSPGSDPLPFHRGVRQAAGEVIATLHARGIAVFLMTRGWVDRSIIAQLAGATNLSRVAVGLMTHQRQWSRILEPRAASPKARLLGLKRLTEAGVPVEVRLEPLIPGVTDTREHLLPLLEALAKAGARELVAHYLFIHPAIHATWDRALAQLGWAEKLSDAYTFGPIFRIGRLGATLHLPLEPRKEGLARVMAWAAEFGLRMNTGSTQNPDFRTEEIVAPPTIPIGKFSSDRTKSGDARTSRIPQETEHAAQRRARTTASRLGPLPIPLSQPIPQTTRIPHLDPVPECLAAAR